MMNNALIAALSMEAPSIFAWRNFLKAEMLFKISFSRKFAK